VSSFILIHNTHVFDKDSLNGTFESKSLHFSSKFELGNYNLYIYSTPNRKDFYHYYTDDTHVFAFGTLTYKAKTSRESIISLLTDFVSDKFVPENLKGVYLILVYFKSKLSFFNDFSNIYSLYHSIDGRIMSSSFLALLSIPIHNLTYNKKAIREVLLTGSLIGPETIVNEVNRFERKVPSTLIDISFYKVEPYIIQNTSDNKSKSIDEQLRILEEYFESLKAVGNEYGVNIGLTGGLDSRLILALCIKHFKQPTCYSHYRKLKNTELEIAENICKIKNISLISPKIKASLDMTPEEMKSQLFQAFNYMDGHIRVNAFWTEEYNTVNYIKQISSISGILINGIGGEQYRNQERIIRKNINFNSWLYYEMAYRNSGNVFYSKKDKIAFMNYISAKARILLNIYQQKKVSHTELKRYLNEVYIPACRGVKTFLENQFTYSLAPCAEYVVSSNSYSAISFLGLSKSFELQMIRKLDPELAEIVSSYGFAPNNNEPLISRLFTVLKEIVPLRIYYYFFYKVKSKSNFYSKFIKMFPFALEYENNIINLDLKINLNQLKRSPALSPLLISLGYFMDFYKNKIK
jgi:hypothetical protein